MHIYIFHNVNNENIKERRENGNKRNVHAILLSLLRENYSHLLRKKIYIY